MADIGDPPAWYFISDSVTPGFSCGFFSSANALPTASGSASSATLDNTLRLVFFIIFLP